MGRQLARAALLLGLPWVAQAAVAHPHVRDELASPSRGYGLCLDLVLNGLPVTAEVGPGVFNATAAAAGLLLGAARGSGDTGLATDAIALASMTAWVESRATMLVCDFNRPSSNRGGLGAS